MDGEVHSVQHYVITFVSDLWQVWFSLGTPASSANKTDRHDLTVLLFNCDVKHHDPNQLYPLWVSLIILLESTVRVARGFISRCCLFCFDCLRPVSYMVHSVSLDYCTFHFL